MNASSDPRPAPKLVVSRAAARPDGVALVLHGGGGRSNMPVSPTQLSVLRMIPIARRIGSVGDGRLAVFRLLNAVRGMTADPLANLRWAMDQIRERHPDVPVALVGHSLGGSVALAGAGEDAVCSVVALAPWLSGSESVRQLAGRATLIVHGDQDRVTSCRGSESYAARARAADAAVSFIRVTRGEHTMLRRLSVFDSLAAQFVLATLVATPIGRELRSSTARTALAARNDPADYQI